MGTTLEIEIDGPANEALVFPPLPHRGRLRGRFDPQRIADPLAVAKFRAVKSIPGLRLGIDADSGTAYVAEPLHDPEHAQLKQSLEFDERRQKVCDFLPAREELPGVHAPSWLYWLKRAVEANLARVTKGKLPERIEGTPQLDFHVTPPEDREKSLASIIERNNQLLELLLKKMK